MSSLVLPIESSAADFKSSDCLKAKLDFSACVASAFVNPSSFFILSKMFSLVLPMESSNPDF